jgi:hypothetical protein
MMTEESAVLDLPPVPPIYVEVREAISARHCDNRMYVSSADCGKVPPEDHPPHDHEDGGEEPTPLRINVSDTLKVTENLIVEVQRVGE